MEKEILVQNVFMYLQPVSNRPKTKDIVIIEQPTEMPQLMDPVEVRQKQNLVEPLYCVLASLYDSVNLLNPNPKSVEPIEKEVEQRKEYSYKYPETEESFRTRSKGYDSYISRKYSDYDSFVKSPSVPLISETVQGFVYRKTSSKPVESPKVDLEFEKKKVKKQSRSYLML